MKKLFCCFLALFLFAISACSSNGASESTLVFYYPRSNYQYNSESGVISYEKKNGNLRQNSLEEFISQYMKGPSDPALYCPLSKDIQLLEFKEDNTGLHITFDAALSKLSPTDLSLGLAAFAKTLYQITDAESICIHAAETLLDGETKMVFKRDMIYLFDSFTDQIPTTETSGETQ